MPGIIPPPCCMACIYACCWACAWAIYCLSEASLGTKSCIISFIYWPNLQITIAETVKKATSNAILEVGFWVRYDGTHFLRYGEKNHCLREDLELEFETALLVSSGADDAPALGSFPLLRWVSCFLSFVRSLKPWPSVLSDIICFITPLISKLYNHWLILIFSMSHSLKKPIKI